MSLRWDTKLFDEKLTTHDLYKWDGSDKNADAWRRRVRDYIIGKCNLLRPMMDWAEAMEYSACSEDLIMSEYASRMVDVNQDIRVMSRHLWP